MVRINYIDSPPPTNCAGYPDPLPHDDQPQINFFIDCENGVNLACSLMGPKKSSLLSQNEDTPTKSLLPHTLDDILHFIQNTNHDDEATKVKSKRTVSSILKKKAANGNKKRDQNSDRPKVIIICHGYLCWRNQWLLSSLASHLSTCNNSNEIAENPINDYYYTLRFDFRGNGHSTGTTWKFANYEEEYDDLSKVISCTETILNLKVVCVVGHSQGSAAVLRYAALATSKKGILQHEDIQPQQEEQHYNIPLYVNLAGRCLNPSSDTNDPYIHLTPSQRQSLMEDKKLKLPNFFLSSNKTADVADRVITIDDMERRKLYDITPYISSIQNSSILTIHGGKDDIVPVQDAYEFDKQIGSRDNNHHYIRIIEEANHNFNGLKYVGDISGMILNTLSSYSL